MTSKSAGSCRINVTPRETACGQRTRFPIGTGDRSFPRIPVARDRAGFAHLRPLIIHTAGLECLPIRISRVLLSRFSLKVVLARRRDLARGDA